MVNELKIRRFSWAGHAWRNLIQIVQFGIPEG